MKRIDVATAVVVGIGIALVVGITYTAIVLLLGG